MIVSMMRPNRKQVNHNFNVKNYISLKRGVNRPDCTYKTAKMIFQNIHTRLKWIVVVSKGEENWMAYIYQRLIDACIGLASGFHRSS